MGAGRHRPLYLERPSPIHRLAPECKILCTLGFVFAVVATPREAFWAFAVYAVALLVLARVAGLGPSALARRLVVETPFLAFAVFLPFLGRGAQVDVAGVSISVEGLWAAWNIVAKATLGVAASSVLVATTTTREVLVGLERLHVPRVLTGIATFMIRYAEVVAGELRAMQTARISRGSNPRWIWQAKVVATSAGTLFVRTYERGERVYLAMQSRGYAGALPDLDHRRTDPSEWVVAATVPALAAFVACAAWFVA
jgi:cobalt/nickel transport system permease protein